MSIQIPLYRVDRLAFWRRHAKLNSINLSKMDLTGYALHPTPWAGRQLKPGRSQLCQFEPNSTEHDKNQGQDETDSRAIDVKLEPEDVISLLYEGHIIKQEIGMVIGPTEPQILQKPNYKFADIQDELTAGSDVPRAAAGDRQVTVKQETAVEPTPLQHRGTDECDMVALNFQKTQKQDVEDKHQTVKLDTVTVASKQYRQVNVRGTKNLKQNKTKNDHQEPSEKSLNSVTVPKRTQLTHVKRKDRENLNKCVICDWCQKQFIRKIYLIRHLKSHAGITYYNDKREKNLKRKDSVARSVKRHNMKLQTGFGTTYYCDKCDKKYNRKESLLQHVKLHSGTSYCDKCDKNFSLKHNLVRHMKLHTRATTYYCDKCDKKFKRKDYLVQHMGQHIGKIYCCDKCDKKYNRKDCLAQHMAQHTGTAYCCDKCDKKFNRKDSLAQHIKLHSATTYYCNKCDKKYTRKDSLVQHMKLHTGTTYNCDKCDKKYNRKKCLFRHMKLHNGTTYYCNKCEKKYNRQDSLVQHMKLHASPTYG